MKNIKYNDDEAPKIERFAWRESVVYLDAGRSVYGDGGGVSAASCVPALFRGATVFPYRLAVVVRPRPHAVPRSSDSLAQPDK